MTRELRRELPADDDRDAYTVEEASRRIGLSTKRIYELIRDDSFPHVRVGERRYLVPKRRLQLWLNGDLPVDAGRRVESALKH